MSTPRGSIVLFAILCFVLNTSTAEERIAFRKHYTFPSKSELFFNPKFYRVSDDYHNLTYILCDDYDELHKSERNCTVVHDTQPEKSCPVTLRTNNNGEQGLDYLEAFQFGPTRAVVVWPDYGEPGSIKCTILDYTTCEAKDVVLMENVTRGYSKIIESTYFVAYEDSFEIVMLSSWFSNTRDKFHVDAKGNVTPAPDRWSGTLMYDTSAFDIYRAIVADSKPKFYLQFTRSEMSFKWHDGRNQVFAKFPKPIYVSNKVVSTVHETIGVAVHDRPDDKRVDVLLFDQEGKLKLNTTVQYQVNMRYIALRNLADGGFLLFAVGSEKPDNYPWNWKLQVDTYYLTRVDANGKVVGTVKRDPGPTCQGKHREGLGLQVFENEAKEYCIVIECSLFFEGIFMGLISSGSQLDLVVKCYTDDDFSNDITGL